MLIRHKMANQLCFNNTKKSKRYQYQNNIRAKMQSDSPSIEDLQYLDRETTMPLLNAKYPPECNYLITIDYEKFTQLKKHIEARKFDKKANRLAEELLPFGESNYNCWYVKKMCFLNKVVSYEHELEFSEETIMEKIKSFQIWEHRRFLAEHSKNYKQQYRLIDKALELEYKNYHAWSYRVWIVDHVQNYEEEVSMTDRWLQKDCFNNSVWAYRTHLMKKLISKIDTQGEKIQFIKKEIKWVIRILEKHSEDEATWNYLRGYFASTKLSGQYSSSNKYVPTVCSSYSDFPQILQFVKRKIQLLSEEKTTSNSAIKIRDCAEVQCLITLICIESHDPSTTEYARNTCLVLAQKQPQKANYWKWLRDNIES